MPVAKGVVHELMLTTSAENVFTHHPQAPFGVTHHYSQESRDMSGQTSQTVQHLYPEGLHRNPAFTNVVVVSAPARTIYIGGQNAVDASGNIVGKGDLKAQTEQIFKNLEIALEAAGATLHDIIKWNIYLVQGQDVRAGFEVFQQAWGREAKPPLITGVFVAGLANPDFLVEIEAVAVVAG
jgi:enamine deaminase RidA (YjgF/YER057c/UK114 family)